MLLAAAQPQRYLRQEEAPEDSTPRYEAAETGGVTQRIDLYDDDTAHDDTAHDGVDGGAASRAAASFSVPTW